MNIIPDIDATKKRITKLNEYFTNHVLFNDQMICHKYDICSKGINKNHVYYEGQLHHVGKFYDILVEGIPLRIVIVGQEYGHAPSLVTLDERYKQIMESAFEYRFNKQDKPARNPHMRGTTSALRLLLGKELGVDYDSEFVNFNDDRKAHLFDTFALVNYLLCSRVFNDNEKPTKKGTSTTIMKNNCSDHFNQVMKILSPTVVIVQGKSFWRFIKRSFSNMVSLKPGLFEVHLPEGKAIILPFSHPSAHGEYNWGWNDCTPYLVKTVKPTIQLALTHLGINIKTETVG